jgi:hypothetical protein
MWRTVFQMTDHIRNNTGERAASNALLLPQITTDLFRAYSAYWSGIAKYTNEFMLPYWIALNSFDH